MADRDFSLFCRFGAAVVAFASVPLAARAVPSPAPAIAAPFVGRSLNLTKPPGPLYVTLDDGSKLPLARFTLRIRSGEHRAILATMVVPDVDASSFLSSEISGQKVGHLIVTSPSVTIELADVFFTGFGQSAHTTVFPLALQNVTVTENGKRFVVSALVHRTAPIEAPGAVVGAAPSLTLPRVGTLGLVSDTLSVQSAHAALGGLASGTSESRASVQFKDADGFALVGDALDGVTYRAATLTTAAGAFDVHELGVGSLTATLDSSGLATVHATLSFTQLTLASGATLTGDDAAAPLKLLLPSGKGKAATIALLSATIGAARVASSDGSSTASFTINDAHAMPLIKDVLEDKILDSIVVVAPSATLRFARATLVSGNGTTTSSGGTTTFALSFQNVEVDAAGKRFIHAWPTRLASATQVPVAPGVAVPNMSVALLGTMPLASETFSTLGSISSPTGSGAGRSQSKGSATFTIDDVRALPLWQAAQENASLGTVHVRLASLDYELSNAMLDSVQVAFDVHGEPAVSGALSFSRFRVGTAAKAAGSAAGALMAKNSDASRVATWLP